MRTGALLTTLLTTVILATACEPSPLPARGQLLVIVDTDLPLVGQIATHPELSPIASVDTVRVDVLDADGQRLDGQELTVPESAGWPISFGVRQGPSNIVTVRVRIFRALLAKRSESEGEAQLEPFPETTVDRLASIALPSKGVRTVRLRLVGDCTGHPASFVNRTSCMDGARPAVSALDAFELDPQEPESTRVGSWSGAQERPCTLEAPERALCIPGGMSVLGDPTAVGDGRFPLPFPALPVVLSPFYMDETEMTVGRYRSLARASKVGKERPIEQGAPGGFTYAECTWLGDGASGNDALPLSCVTWAHARTVCRALGGDLPTEAQWEHAARGRGEQRKYPWGEAPSTCCRTSISRPSVLMQAAECVAHGMGAEPVGSHRPAASCDGLGDESRDGVLDLGGSLYEWTLDAAHNYDHACWGIGIRVDRWCDDPTADNHTTRGGEWSGGTATVASAARAAHQVGSGSGFRCVYPASDP